MSSLASREESMPNSEGTNVNFLSFWSILLLILVPLATSQSPAHLNLVGVGTTSPLPIFPKWFQEFEKTRPDVHLSYVPSGSGTGIEMITSGAADFGSTDAPLSDKELAKAKVLQFAMLAGAIVPIYNLPGVAQLKLSPRALAGIYLGTITSWNDLAISGPNPQIQLPATSIAVIHSAGGRGSTYVWSDYLSKVDVRWRTMVGRGISVTWPVGREADGYGDMARMVKQTPNSIGYVGANYAQQNQLPYAQVQNAARNFTSADKVSIRAAAVAGAKAIPSDFRSAITNPQGVDSYPISTYIWILISKKGSTKQEAMKDFLRWALNEGQTYVEPTGFAGLPPEVVEEELERLAKIR
jgi:phosphate transport system substrate-binding protein